MEPNRESVPPRKVSERRSELLSIYLNDHLTGATGGVDLARRLARSFQTTAHADALRDLAGEIDEDRETLLRIMARLDVRPSHPKIAAGWIAEKAARLKLNGRLIHRSPLTSIVELEAMYLGVEGKAAGWRTLRTLAALDSRIEISEIDALLERAERQAALLDELRLAAVAAVL
jgi:hypothetical protein